MVGNVTDYENSIKEKQWTDLKTAVGTVVKQENNNSTPFTLDELLLNINGVSFDSLVSQNDIQTEEDKRSYSDKGYYIPLTVEEFKAKFNLDPGCIWYTPSISQQSLYFNEDTLSAAPFHLGLVLYGMGPSLSSFYEVIKEIENEVEKGDYYSALMSLPDTMQIEYFNKLVEKKVPDIPGLYDLFFNFYVNSDYGFGAIKDSTFKAILASKTATDKRKTSKAIKDLPDTVKVYRGGNSASTPFSKAFSWTLDPNVATFFACRRGSQEGYIAEAEISKKDIIDAFLDRGEQEIIADPATVNITQVNPMYGTEFLEQTLPKVAQMYHKYRDELMSLEFAQNSNEHGYSHEARVMLLGLMIGTHLNLSSRDLKVLATASLYHDLQRVNDIDDEKHGRDGKEFYHQTVANPDPLVEFLCEYHCLPDEEGYKEIRNDRKLSKNRSRAKLLYDIFKDADALDRCRFGLRALDVNQLRLPISKKLPLVAKLCFENVQIPERDEVTKEKDAENIKPSLAAVISAAEQKSLLSESVVNNRQEYSL